MIVQKILPVKNAVAPQHKPKASAPIANIHLFTIEIDPGAKCHIENQTVGHNNPQRILPGKKTIKTPLHKISSKVPIIIADEERTISSLRFVIFSNLKKYRPINVIIIGKKRKIMPDNPICPGIIVLYN